MQYGKAIDDAFSYARHSKAALLYASFTIGVALAVLLLTVLTASASGLTANPATWLRNPPALGVVGLVLITGVVAFAVGSLAITGTIIRNAAHSESLSQSWAQFSPRLGSMVGVAVVVSGISFASSMLFQTAAESGSAFSGLVLVIYLAVSLALAFFLAFAEYAVALEGKNMGEAIRRSVDLAREKPVDVLLALVVSTVVSLALMLAVMAVLILIVALALLALRVRLNAPSLPALALLGIAAILAVFGVMVAQVVQLHIMANAFSALTGKEKENQEKPSTTTPSRITAKKPASKKKSKTLRRATRR
ncbi:hypothetical protein HYV43_02375 [Candidatus Micrarchaeota archaeon]|nr:hypothetical protein [Candidatus Micrarchaeota archaeon]